MTAAAQRLLAHRFGRVSIVFAGLSPWLFPVLSRWLRLGALEGLLRIPYAVVCHQRLDRTLVLLGTAMPVCSRCAGIFAGAACGALLAWPRLELRTARVGVLAAAALMALDVALQDLGLHPLWHATRLATGGLVGYLGAITFTSLLAREARSNARG